MTESLQFVPTCIVGMSLGVLSFSQAFKSIYAIGMTIRGNRACQAPDHRVSLVGAIARQPGTWLFPIVLATLIFGLSYRNAPIWIHWLLLGMAFSPVIVAVLALRVWRRKVNGPGKSA